MQRGLIQHILRSWQNFFRDVWLSGKKIQSSFFVNHEVKLWWNAARSRQCFSNGPSKIPTTTAMWDSREVIWQGIAWYCFNRVNNQCIPNIWCWNDSIGMFMQTSRTVVNLTFWGQKTTLSLARLGRRSTIKASKSLSAFHPSGARTSHRCSDSLRIVSPAQSRSG
jgi:hypothetical protein